MASRLYMRFRAALMPTNMADSSQDRAMAKGLYQQHVLVVLVGARYFLLSRRY